MKSTMFVASVILALLLSSMNLLAPCEEAASTRNDATCPWYCDAPCSAQWTQSTPLWCKSSENTLCQPVWQDPPINITINYVLGHCGTISDTCWCIVDMQWSNIETEMWTNQTVPCGGG